MLKKILFVGIINKGQHLLYFICLANLGFNKKLFSEKPFLSHINLESFFFYATFYPLISESNVIKINR